MKSFIVLALFVAVAAAAPLAEDRDAYIVRDVNDNIGVEGYNFESETSNGISRKETGELVNRGTENEALVVRGEFSYVLDGVTYRVVYFADQDGFHASGAHLPQP